MKLNKFVFISDSTLLPDFYANSIYINGNGNDIELTNNITVINKISIDADNKKIIIKKAKIIAENDIIYIKSSSIEAHDSLFTSLSNIKINARNNDINMKNCDIHCLTLNTKCNQFKTINCNMNIKNLNSESKTNIFSIDYVEEELKNPYAINYINNSSSWYNYNAPTLVVKTLKFKCNTQPFIMIEQNCTMTGNTSIIGTKFKCTKFTGNLPIINTIIPYEEWKHYKKSSWGLPTCSNECGLHNTPFFRSRSYCICDDFYKKLKNSQWIKNNLTGLLIIFPYKCKCHIVETKCAKKLILRPKSLVHIIRVKPVKILEHQWLEFLVQTMI